MRMTLPSFKDAEQAGWSARAAGYDDGAGRITRQAIGPILQALEPLSGRQLLDVCCGTGRLAAEASRRGAEAAGVDFAAPMIAAAGAAHPGLCFVVGDGESLPFADGAFDAVACPFGILHMAAPERAMAEAFRVLRPGGRYAFTVWCEPDAGFDLQKIVIAAIRAHGARDVKLPPAPPAFQFANPETARTALAGAGFTAVERRRLDLEDVADTGAEVVAFIHAALVRTSMLLEMQPAANRARIEAAIAAGAEHLRRGGQIVMRWPAAMLRAVRP
jgi:SAM-dependent methyltransferase